MHSQLFFFLANFFKSVNQKQVVKCTARRWPSPRPLAILPNNKLRNILGCTKLVYQRISMHYKKNVRIFSSFYFGLFWKKNGLDLSNEAADCIPLSWKSHFFLRKKFRLGLLKNDNWAYFWGLRMVNLLEMKTCSMLDCLWKRYTQNIR